MFGRELNFDRENLIFAALSLTLLKVIHVLVVVISYGLCRCRFMDRQFQLFIGLSDMTAVCGRGRKSNGLATDALFFSPPLVSRYELRANATFASLGS